MKFTNKIEVFAKITTCRNCNVPTVKPKIELSGKEIAKAGFDFGEELEVYAENGHILIVRCSK